MKLEDYIASIENYPKEGVTFRDISPLMADGNAYSYAIREIVQYATDKKIDMIVGPEARGFIVGCPVAFELGIGFAPAYDSGYGNGLCHLADCNLLGKGTYRPCE